MLFGAAHAHLIGPLPGVGDDSYTLARRDTKPWTKRRDILGEPPVGLRRHVHPRGVEGGKDDPVTGRVGKYRTERLVDHRGEIQRTLGEETLGERARPGRIVDAPEEPLPVENVTDRFESGPGTVPRTVPGGNKTTGIEILSGSAQEHAQARTDQTKHGDGGHAHRCYRYRTLRTSEPKRCYPLGVHDARDADPRRRFGRRLAHLRRERGWTQGELSERSGMNRTYISGLENGERNIGLLNLVRLATALESDPVELLRWAPDATEGSGPEDDH